MPSPRAKSQVKSHQRLKTLSLFFSGQCSLVQRPTCSGIRELNERMKDREREREMEEERRLREEEGRLKRSKEEVESLPVRDQCFLVHPPITCHPLWPVGNN